jgi:hypothetical protein
MRRTPHDIKRGGLAGIAFASVLGACAAAATVLDSGISETNLYDVSGNDSNAACVESAAAKVSSARPVDIIFIIDNSGSMVEEIEAIRNNINNHFADVMGKAGLDYRVIMIVKHGPPGTYYGTTCIESPLSTIPKGGCETILDDPPGINPGKFYHYSYDVQSNDSPCIILNSLSNKNGYIDDFGLSQDGWIKWLRTSAFKVFIQVTDDSAGCWWYPDESDLTKKKIFNDFQSSLGGQVFSIEFDKMLLKIAPEQFGTPEDRNYVFYSIVGMKEKPNAIDEDFGLQIDPNGKPDDPFTPDEEIVSNVCSTAVAAGHGYQALSRLTGGLRFPVCNAEKFDVVFERIANSIDSITTSVCAIQIPDLGDEGPVDVSTVKLRIENVGVNPSYFSEVKDENSCSNAENEYYIDKEGNYVILCPETCKIVKSSSENVKLSAGCVPVVR